MANTFSLDDIITAAEKKYGSLDNEEFGVKLLPVLRLSSAERKELAALSKEDDDAVEDRDYLEVMQGWLRIVADNKVGAEKMIEAIGDRLDVLKEIQDRWSEKTQSGEAQPSES